jgi:phosphomannomutase
MVETADMEGHQFAPAILREYDIRGEVGVNLSEADAYAVGRGFATVVAAGGGNRISVAYDGRDSSPGLEAAVVQGIADAGLTAVRIGRGPTPMMYFSVFDLGTHGGIMVTGSHNPPEDNGFKIMLGRKSFFGEQIQKLGQDASAGAWTEGTGSIEERSVWEAYLSILAAAYRAGTEYSVAWDCGNGATGDVVTSLCDRLPGTHVLLNNEVDGRFPAHHPDPTVPENLVQLQQTVIAQNLDIGVAFDGDGDRIGIIDGQGRILWGDQILALLARDVLREMPGALIIADVKASQALFDDVAQHGGEPMMYRVGHSSIKSKMAETGAPLAGEMSGHIFMADKYFGYDDAVYVALRFLDMLARSGRSVAELLDSLPKMFNTPEVRFACPDERKFAVVDEVKSFLDGGDAEVNDIDGVRVSNADGWWLLRASNTQPALVARCEGKDKEALARLKLDLVAALAPSGVSPPEDF